MASNKVSGSGNQLRRSTKKILIWIFLIIVIILIGYILLKYYQMTSSGFHGDDFGFYN